MPSSFSSGLTALLLLGSTALAQHDGGKNEAPPPLLKIEEVKVGFRSYDDREASSRFKAGLWAPVYVRVKAGDKDIRDAILELNTIDSEEVGTIKRTPFAIDGSEARTLITYAKPGKVNAEFDVVLHALDKNFTARPAVAESLKLNTQLLLTLGARVPDLQTALRDMGRVDQGPEGEKIKSTWPRFAGYETDPALLPDSWLGYQAADLIVLTTANQNFLEFLLLEQDGSRLRALAEWVRHGGQLVIAVSWLNQAEVARLLQKPAWNPPLPVTIPTTAGKVDKQAPPRLLFERWGLANRPLTDPKNRGVILAELQPPGTTQLNWEVLADTGKEYGSRPLIVRFPYGLGGITLLAFSVDQPPFTQWEGRVDFWKALITRIAPRAPRAAEQAFDAPVGVDVTTALLTSLDNFDVKVIPFGWVALFILLYIIVVGPLDYLLLKFVFKRLEWTWFTFPTVVATVALAAYFTAYALKGNDLKINKVDVLDFDLRTDLDARQHTKRAQVYGRSFITILSPRIQNYTIGVEPNPRFWGGSDAGKDGSAVTVDVVSWLGQPDDNPFVGMSRSRGQSFFRKPYEFAQETPGLRGVPIPVWSTKSFIASWAGSLDVVPFQSDLTYHLGKDLKVSGTMRNHFPFDLEDVWLFYRNQAFKIARELPGKNAGSPETTLALEGFQGLDIVSWIGGLEGGSAPARPSSDKGTYNPTREIRQILLFDKADVSKDLHNHLLRSLDLSWRLQEENNWRDTSLREAILYARVPFRTGAAESLVADADHPLSSRLWLGALPGDNVPRPTLPGTLNQDTYIRIILPVRAP